MTKNRTIDSSILDKAVAFATAAHKNIERKGKGFPYIVHPLEAVSIASTMTSDQEVLAAAVLHDTVEDTDTTIEDIRKEFGNRVAEIVDFESDRVFEGLSDKESWKKRKEITIQRIANSPIDAKIVALADKLSNMRAIYRDYLEEGSKVWEKFHVKDAKEHEWYFRGLADSLYELKDTISYKEFTYLIEKVFN